ncbi:MAG: hypothetical protein N7Q72_05865, partial [Spiroplasma sp. Tabriz.8]|nr:hypothetical protein [Spiroplasma sp. Tabriz.8]
YHIRFSKDHTQAVSISTRNQFKDTFACRYYYYYYYYYLIQWKSIFYCYSWNLIMLHYFKIW